MSEPHPVPVSPEVAFEQIMRCPCATCRMYAVVHRAVTEGTPERRRELLEVISAMGHVLVAAIGKDIGA